MTFDNNKFILKINKLRYTYLLSFSTLLIVVIFSGFFDEALLGIERKYYIIFVVFIYACYNIIKYILNYNYFYFNDEGMKLVFRYVSLRPFDTKKKAIAIPKKNFAGYKYVKSFFNLKEEIILSVKTQKGVANYPPISISALSVKQKNLLKNSLNQFV